MTVSEAEAWEKPKGLQAAHEVTVGADCTALTGGLKAVGRYPYAPHS